MIQNKNHLPIIPEQVVMRQTKNSHSFRRDREVRFLNLLGRGNHVDI